MGRRLKVKSIRRKIRISRRGSHGSGPLPRRERTRRVCKTSGSRLADTTSGPSFGCKTKDDWKGKEDKDEREREKEGRSRKSGGTSGEQKWI